jgi:hypothetical protein
MTDLRQFLEGGSAGDDLADLLVGSFGSGFNSIEPEIGIFKAWPT